MGLGRRGEPVPRLLSGLGLQPAGSLSAQGRRGGPRAGRPVDPRAQHLVHGASGGLAEALSKRSFGGQCFFCNSGAEANEAAIKLARVFGHERGRFKIVTMEGGFHGRTYAALTATAQPKYHVGFEPMVPGFVYVPYNDLGAVAEVLDDQTAAVLVEPIQGEGGINVPDPDYLSGLRQLCDRAGCAPDPGRGPDRHGTNGPMVRLSASGVVPDILTCAKALAGGLAAGVMIARPAVAAALKPGMHASTFGGNPIACRAALAAVETIEAGGAPRAGHRHRRAIPQPVRCPSRRAPRPDPRDPHPRHHDRPGTDRRGDRLRRRGDGRRLLINATHGTVIRLLPALTITDDQIDAGCAILADVLRQAVV